MELTGQLFVPAPRDRVFATLRDPHAVIGCLDGASDLVVVDTNHFRASMQTKVGFVRLTFQLEVELAEELPGERIVLRIKGAPKGLVGRLSATSVTELSDAPGGTNIHYCTDIALSGKLGSIGQAAIRAKANEMQAQFAEQLAIELVPSIRTDPG